MRVLIRRIALLLAFALGVTLIEAQPIVSPWSARADDPDSSDDTDGSSGQDDDPDPGAGEPKRPDPVAAMVTAQASGKRVEDLSQGDEFTRVFANPDGSWTSDTTARPQRARDGDGEWAPVDTTLSVVDGRVVPANVPVDISLSGGGDRLLAEAVPTARSTSDAISWRWPSHLPPLPEPVLKDNTATYVGAAPGGGDLVAIATSTGFTYNVVLHEPPTADGPPSTPSDDSSEAPTDSASPDPSAEPGADATGSGAGRSSGPVYEVPVVTPGAKLSETAEGSLKVVDQSGSGRGDVLASAPAPVMWDSSADPDTGEPVVKPVNMSVEASRLPNGTPAQTVALSPDYDFLNDPDTVYPVTIDPTYTLFTTMDTYVLGNYPGGGPYFETPHDQEDRLLAGTQDVQTRYRSFLKFPGDPTWDGTQILSAHLTLFNYGAGSCKAGAVRAARVTEAWSTSSITWANQPAVTTSGAADYSAAHGYTGSTSATTCANSTVKWDISSMVQAWANNTATNHGLRIAAVDEQNVNTFRKYLSGDHPSRPADRPRIITTYNRGPSVPTGVVMEPVTSYAPPAGSAALYTFSATPKVSGKSYDVDGSKVWTWFYAFSSPTATATGSALGSCRSPMVASNQTTGCTMSTLPDNSTVYLRAKAVDQHGMAAGKKPMDDPSGWSAPQAIRVGSTKPAAPVISCPSPYGNKSWAGTAPAADLVCTISAVGTGFSAPGAIQWSLNGVDRTDKITPSSSPATAKVTVTVPRTLGGYRLTATAIAQSGALSDPTTYGFGYGPFAITTPKPRTDPDTGAALAAVTTSDLVEVVAEGPPNSSAGPDPVVRWRLAGSGGGPATSEWADAPATIQFSSPTGEKTTVTGVVDTTAIEGLDQTRPVLIDLQLCLPSGGAGADTCTWDASPVTVYKVPHAFGGNYPVADAAVGQIALWTGEFSLDASDVSEPGFGTSLGISRNHNSYGGITSGGAGVFGPGWTAVIDGPGSGFTGMTLVDSSLEDGVLSLVDPSGDSWAWTNPSVTDPGGRRTGEALQSGTWAPLDEKTSDSGVILTVSGSGAGTQVEVIEAGGAVTTFAAAAAPASGEPFVFAPRSVESEEGSDSATFKTDGTGRTTEIRSSAPSVTCNWSSVTVLADGCHRLRLAYGTSGNSDNRLAEIMVDHGTGSGVTTASVVNYTYDSAGRLVTATDVRAGLVTSYGYDGASARITSIAPPGLKTIRLAYTWDDKVKTISRDNPSGTGTTDLQQVRYGIPLGDDAAAAGLPDLDEGGVAAWNQRVVPTYAAALFEQGAPTVDALPTNITAEQWKHANIAYADVDGTSVNGAIYGAGRWLLTAVDLDTTGNVTRSLTPNDIAAIQDGRVAVADAGTLNVYGEVKNPAGEVTIPAGIAQTETFGPARWASLRSSAPGSTSPGGGLGWVRPHTKTNYDEAAPNGGLNPVTGRGYGLPTSTATRPWDVGTSADLIGADVTTAESRTGYEALTAGDKSGWEIGAATSQTTIMAGGQEDLVSRTRYDDQGRVIETRQPSSDGSDAGTRQTIYYAAGANGHDASCGNKPQLAGLVCVIKYAGGNLPEQRFTSYNDNLQLLTVEEWVAGTKRRTTKTTYDDAGRKLASWVATHGMPDSAASTGSKVTYDETSGLPTVVTAVDASGSPLSGKTVTTGYDGWGRPISYEPVAGEVTMTAYGDSGQVATLTDPRGTTTYTYDGVDADGKLERRGLPTKVTTSRPGSGAVEFTGAYGPEGELVVQKAPGAITQHTAYDTAGQLTSTDYTGQVSVPDPDGTLIPTNDVGWLGWAQRGDIFGRAVHEWTPEGAAYSGDTTGAAAGGYSRAYTYDRAGRLTDVTDRSVPSGAGSVDVESDGTSTLITTPTGTTCQVRTYAFDLNGNRTGLTKKGPNSGAPAGSCGTTVAVSRSWSWDGADRPTNSGYVIDALGRQTAVPAIDSANTATGGGALALGYYDNDTLKTVTQPIAGGTMSTTYALDAVGRRSSESTTKPGAPTSVVSEFHYVNAGDNPGWARRTAGTDVTTTRYVHGLAGGLSAVLTSEGASPDNAATLKLALSNPHGDVVATVAVPNSGPATGLDAWSDYDEYGNARTTSQPLPLADRGNGYGWLGTQQRGTNSHGLLLMGARPYNPTTGQFTSRDPVYGGNTTTYAYPQDPVNQSDLTGEGIICTTSKCWRKLGWRTMMIGAEAATGFACSLLGPGAGTLCDILMGGVLGIIDYVTYRKIVSHNPIYWGNALKQGVKGMYSAIGNNILTGALVKKLKSWVWSSGKRVADKLRRKLEAVGLHSFAAVVWTAYYEIRKWLDEW